MSRAIAIYHGEFGRAALYQLNRPMLTHAHREGHLIFHVGGRPGRVGVGDVPCACSETTGAGVSPWQPHGFTPPDHERGSLCLVLYIKPCWFSAAPGRSSSLRFGRPDIPVSRSIAGLVGEIAALLRARQTTDIVDQRLVALTTECFEASWRGRPVDDASPPSVRDHRVRKSIRILSETGGADLHLDCVARQAGLSRPHFYKLFRRETGLTPNLYLKTLLMERAIERVGASDEPVAEIGFDLGFSSQSGFTRFFSAHVGMAPTNYRQVTVVRPH